MKNKSFPEGKRIFVTKYQRKEEIEEFNEDSCDKTDIKWKKQEEALKNEARV